MSPDSVLRGVSTRFIARQVRQHLGSVEGLEHVPADGPFVLVPNHTSYFDHFAVQVVLSALRGTPTWFLTKRESFDKRVPRWWARAWYGIPVDREAPTSETVREVHRVLASPDALCVYPEGTRGSGRSLLPFKPGAFRFALANHVPVIPLGIVGTNTVLARGDRWFRRGRVHLVFGPALTPPATGTAAQKAEQFSCDARRAIEALIARATATSVETSCERRAAAGAAEVDRLVTMALDADGQLPRRVGARYARLASVVRGIAPADPALRAQQVRLRGLRAAAGSKFLLVLWAPAVRWGAERVLRASPGDSVANYVLGRWHLSMPWLLGGRLPASVRYLEAAAAAAERGDTRALFGLAEVYLARGDTERGVAMLHRVVAETPSDHPRAAIRCQRAAQRLGDLVQTGERRVLEQAR